MRLLLEEIRIIPRIVWPIAFLIGVGVFALLMFIVAPNDPNICGWPMIGRLTFALGPAVFSFAGVILLGYINADARRRGMRHLLWTLLAIFIPYGIGVILYFILREPLLITCRRCGTEARATFVFCPQCGTELLHACPNCKRAVESEWNRCAYCGTELHLAQKSI